MFFQGKIVRKLASSALGAVALFSMANVMNAEDAKAGGGPAISAESRAVDWNFTRDSVDIEIRPAEGGVYRLATRPGENIFITKQVDRGLVKRMAFIVMPEPPDGDLSSITRDEIADVSKSELTFYVTAICFNSKSVPNPPAGSLKQASDCKPRLRGDGPESNVVPFSKLKTRGVRLGDEFYDQVVGANIKLLDYSFGVDIGDRKANPVSKCCIEGATAEVCSGAVYSEGRWCKAGASIRVAAK